MVQRIRRIVKGWDILMEYKCKLCTAVFHSETDTIMNLVNHQLYAHQELLRPSQAIIRYEFKEIQ